MNDVLGQLAVSVRLNDLVLPDDRLCDHQFADHIDQIVQFPDVDPNGTGINVLGCLLSQGL